MFFIEQIYYIAKNKNDKQNIKELIVGLIISIIGLVILILTLIGSTSINKGLSISFAFNNKLFISLLNTIAVNFLGNGLNNIIIVSNVYMMLMIVLIYLIYKYPKSTIIGLLATGWQFVIFLFIYRDFSTQKTNTIFLIILFIAWINLDEKNLKINTKINAKLSTVFVYIITFFCTFILLISDFNGLNYIKNEITEKYSDSVSISEFINNDLESDVIFVCTNVPRASAIIPYVKNATFINPLNLREFTYVTWDETAFKIVKISRIIENIKKVNYNKKIYLIESIFPDSEKEKQEIKKYQDENVLSEVLYESNTENIICDEAYKIYRINL